jgi:hypothetical protein
MTYSHLPYWRRWASGLDQATRSELLRVLQDLEQDADTDVSQAKTVQWGGQRPRPATPAPRQICEEVTQKVPLPRRAHMREEERQAEDILRMFVRDDPHLHTHICRCSECSGDATDM